MLSMTSKDRPYFLLRAAQERSAAAHSSGTVRARHEEFAGAYEMRLHYIDRGLGDDDGQPSKAEPIDEPIHIFIGV